MPRPRHRLDVLTRQLLQRVCGGDPETAAVVDLRQAGIKTTQGIGSCLEMTTLLLGFNQELYDLSADVRMCRKLWHVDLDHTGIQDLVALRRLRVLGFLRLTSSAVTWAALKGCAEHTTVFNLHLLHGNPQLLSPFVAPLAAGSAQKHAAPEVAASRGRVQVAEPQAYSTAPNETVDTPVHEIDGSTVNSTSRLPRLARSVWQMYRYHVIVLFGDVFCLDGVYVSDAEQEAAWSYAAQVASGALDSPLPHILLPAYAAGVSDEADAEHGFEDMLEHLREQRTALLEATGNSSQGAGTLSNSASEAALALPDSTRRRRPAKPVKRSRAAYWLRVLASQPTMSQLQDQWRLRQLARSYVEDSATLNEHLSQQQPASAVGGSKGAAVSRALLSLSSHMPMCHVAALMQIPLPAFSGLVAVLLASHVAGLPADLTLHAAVQLLADAASKGAFSPEQGGSKPTSGHRSAHHAGNASNYTSSVGSLGLQVQHIVSSEQATGAEATPVSLSRGPQSAHVRTATRAGATAVDDVPSCVLSALSGLVRLPVGVLAGLLQCFRGWVLATSAAVHSAHQMRETHGADSPAAIRAASNLPAEAAPWRALLQELCALETGRHKLVPSPVPPDVDTRNTAVELVRRYHGQLPPGVDERMLTESQLEAFLQEQDRLWAPLLRDGALAPGRSHGDLTCTPSPLVVALTRYIRSSPEAVLSSCGDLFMHFPYTLSAVPLGVPALLQSAATAPVTAHAGNSAKTSSIGHITSSGSIPTEHIPAGSTGSLPGLRQLSESSPSSWRSLPLADAAHSSSRGALALRSTYGQRVAQRVHEVSDVQAHTAAAMRGLLSGRARGPSIVGGGGVPSHQGFSSDFDSPNRPSASDLSRSNSSGVLASSNLPVDNGLQGGAGSTPPRLSHVSMHHGVRHPNTATPFLKGKALDEGLSPGSHHVHGGHSHHGGGGSHPTAHSNPRRGAAMHLTLTPMGPQFGVVDRLVDKQTAVHALNPQPQKWSTSRYQPLVLSDARMKGVTGAQIADDRGVSMSARGGGSSSLGGASGHGSSYAGSLDGSDRSSLRQGSWTARPGRQLRPGGGVSSRHRPPPLKVNMAAAGQAAISGLMSSPMYVGGAKRNSKQEQMLKSSYAVASRGGQSRGGTHALQILPLEVPHSPLQGPQYDPGAAGDSFTAGHNPPPSEEDTGEGETRSGIPFTSLVGLMRRARNAIKRTRKQNSLFSTSEVHSSEVDLSTLAGRVDLNSEAVAAGGQHPPPAPPESERHQESVHQWTLLPPDLSMDVSCLPVPEEVLSAVQGAVSPPQARRSKPLASRHPVQPPMRTGATHSNVIQLTVGSAPVLKPHPPKGQAPPPSASSRGKGGAKQEAHPSSSLDGAVAGGLKEWSVSAPHDLAASIDALPELGQIARQAAVQSAAAPDQRAAATPRQSTRPKTVHGADRTSRGGGQPRPRGVSQGGVRTATARAPQNETPPAAPAAPPQDELIGELADWQVDDESTTSAGRHSSAEHKSSARSVSTSEAEGGGSTAGRSKRSTRRTQAASQAEGAADEHGRPPADDTRSSTQPLGSGPGAVLGEMTDEQLMNLEFLKSNLDSDDEGGSEGGQESKAIGNSASTETRGVPAQAGVMRGEQAPPLSTGAVARKAEAAAKLALQTPLPPPQLRPEHLCVIALRALQGLCCVPAVAHCSAYMLLACLGGEMAIKALGRRVSPGGLVNAPPPDSARDRPLPSVLKNRQVQELLGAAASSSPMAGFVVPACAVALNSPDLAWDKRRMVAVLIPLLSAAYTGLVLLAVLQAAEGGVHEDDRQDASASVEHLRAAGVLPDPGENGPSDTSGDIIELPFDADTHQQLLSCLAGAARELQHSLLTHLPPSWEHEGVPGWCRGSAGMDAAIADAQAGRLALPSKPSMGPQATTAAGGGKGGGSASRGEAMAGLGGSYMRLQACILHGLKLQGRSHAEAPRRTRKPPLPEQAARPSVSALLADTLQAAADGQREAHGTPDGGLLRVPLRKVPPPETKGVAILDPPPNQMDAYSAAGSGRHGIAQLMPHGAAGEDGGPSGPASARVALRGIYSGPHFSIEPAAAKEGKGGETEGVRRAASPGAVQGSPHDEEWGGLDGAVPFMVTPHAAQAAADRLIARLERERVQGGAGNHAGDDDALLATAGVPGAATRAGKSTTDVRVHRGGKGGARAWYSVLGGGHFVVPVEDPLVFHANTSLQNTLHGTAPARSQQAQQQQVQVPDPPREVSPRCRPLAALQATADGAAAPAIPHARQRGTKLLLAGASVVKAAQRQASHERTRASSRAARQQLARKPAVPSRVVPRPAVPKQLSTGTDSTTLASSGRPPQTLKPHVEANDSVPPQAPPPSALADPPAHSHQKAGTPEADLPDTQRAGSAATQGSASMPDSPRAMLGLASASTDQPWRSDSPCGSQETAGAADGAADSRSAIDIETPPGTRAASTLDDIVGIE